MKIKERKIREGKIREGKITDKGTKSKESDKGTRTMNQSKTSRQGIRIRRFSKYEATGASNPLEGLAGVYYP